MIARHSEERAPGPLGFEAAAGARVVRGQRGRAARQHQPVHRPHHAERQGEQHRVALEALHQLGEDAPGLEIVGRAREELRVDRRARDGGAAPMEAERLDGERAVQPVSSPDAAMVPAQLAQRKAARRCQGRPAGSGPPALVRWPPRWARRRKRASRS